MSSASFIKISRSLWRFAHWWIFRARRWRRNWLYRELGKWCELELASSEGDTHFVLLFYEILEATREELSTWATIRTTGEDQVDVEAVDGRILGTGSERG